VIRTIRGATGRAVGIAMAALMAVAVSGCTGPSPDDPDTAFVTPAPPGTEPPGSARPDTDDADGDGEATAADVAFIAAMVEHHEQAVELAGIAPGRVADPELAELAGLIAVTQAAEAESMRRWLERRSSRDDAAAGHDHAESMAGEISRSTIDRAAGLDGAAFDRLFVSAMIPHHRGALEMSEDRLAESGDSSVARWARAIATSQALEIDRMLEIEARLPAG
jgi:uncharacterized protein (DUF305 family)